MGGRGTFASGNNVSYTYKPIGKIDNVPIISGIGEKHDLPMESHSSKMYIKLNPNGTFRTMRFYGTNHLVKLEVAYHVESSLQKNGEPILHYHTYKYNSKYKNGMNRSEAKKLPESMKEKLKKYLIGV